MKHSLSFEQWMEQVNALCLRDWGTSALDILGVNFRAAYNGGETPAQFVSLPYAPIVDARASARRGLHIAPGTAHNASLTVVNRAEVCYT